MPAEPAFVIVGASLAGAKAAETLRAEGFDGAVVLIGQEDQYPYERPPLSKGYLLGKESRESVFVQDSDAWYAEHQVDLRLAATVTSIDRAGRTVGLAGGESVPYDKLLITTGASPRRLNVPGADLGNVLYLRTLPDSERLAATLRRGGRVVIAGAGWIGLETAAAAREFGCEVTVVEPEPGPLHRSLGPELGEVFAALHRSHGVTFRFGEGITELTGSGTVTGAVTSSGEELAADAVIAAVGVTPNVSLAADAGLEVDNGIVVDEALRTSDPDIFAAGDVANALNSLLGRRIRVEHWGNALAAGPIAARSMMGRDASYDWVPYFFSDQYDLGMEVAGLPDPGAYDEVVYRGEKESLEFIAFWLADRVVVAGMNVNVWDVNEDIQALIRSGDTVDPDRLTDPDVSLTDL